LTDKKWTSRTKRSIYFFFTSASASVEMSFQSFRFEFKKDITWFLLKNCRRQKQQKTNSLFPFFCFHSTSSFFLRGKGFVFEGDLKWQIKSWANKITVKLWSTFLFVTKREAKKFQKRAYSNKRINPKSRRIWKRMNEEISHIFSPFVW